MTSDVQSISDESLIQSFQNEGSTPTIRREIFTVLHRRHERRIEVFLASKCAQQTAADVAQEVWLIVWHKLTTLRLEKPFVAWLIGVAKITCKNYCGRNLAHDEKPLDDADFSEGDKTDHAIRFKDVVLVFRRCLERLGDQVGLIVRRRVRGMPHEAIAEELGLTSGHVRNVFSESRERLRSCFERHGVLP